jgi:hypothetical protein
MAHMNPMSSRAIATTTWLACNPPCHQASASCAQANLGFPTDVLDGFGWLCESQVHVATDVRGITRRPGAFNQHPTGMTMARCGDGALTTPLTRGICRGHQAQALHELSRMIDAGEVSEFSDHRDRHHALHAAQGLKGLDYRVQAPGVDLLVECLFETLEACGVRGDRSHLVLEDDVLRGGGTHHRGEPPEVGWAPRGPACIAHIGPAQEGFQAECCRFALIAGSFTGAGEVADGFIVHGGDIDGGEIPRAHQARQLHGITTVGFHAVAGCFRHE